VNAVILIRRSPTLPCATWIINHSLWDRPPTQSKPWSGIISNNHSLWDRPPTQSKPWSGIISVNHSLWDRPPIQSGIISINDSLWDRPIQSKPWSGITTVNRSLLDKPLTQGTRRVKTVETDVNPIPRAGRPSQPHDGLHKSDRGESSRDPAPLTQPRQIGLTTINILKSVRTSMAGQTLRRRSSSS
jgi:hypothetical protein